MHPCQKLTRANLFALCVLSALIVALGAPGTSAGNLAGHSQRMFEELASPAMRDTIKAPDVVLGSLRDIRLTLLDNSSQGLRAQVDALIGASTIDEAKCTAEHQQWLIRQLLKFKQSPLGAYVDSVRQKQRDFCLASFKSRLESATSQSEPSSEQVVQEFSLFLQETADMKNQVYKLDDLPMESLVGALHEYVKHELNLEEVPSMLHEAGENQEEAHAALELINDHLVPACRQLKETYGDFVWMMKIFEPQRPLGLRTRHEQTLWLTKVCVSLDFNSFDMKLSERYNSAALKRISRKSAEKFARLLRSSDLFELVFNNKLERPEVDKALEVLVNERHFLSQNDESEEELLGQVLDQLGESCQDVTRALGDFLWLIDVRLRAAALEPHATLEMLKPVRACQLLPEVMSHQ